MIRFAKAAAVAGLVLGAGVFSVGCQSGNNSSQASAAKDVACDKCAVADVRTPYTVPSYEGPRAVGYFTTKGMECASCRDSAAKYASTGKLEDSACKTCGGTVKAAK
jgi:hypothetical protein